VGAVKEAFAKFGWVDGCLYLLNAALTRLAGDHAKVRRYYLVAQPLDAKLSLPRRLGLSYQTRLVAPGDCAAGEFPRPAAVIDERYLQGSICIAAYQGARFVGFIWICTGDYQEDDVRCRYVLHPGDAAVWDYDLFVVPELRNGVIFVKLWATALEHLRERNKRWSLSRISAFSPDSRAAHRRMGAIQIGSAFFADLLGVQFTIASVPPFLHIAWRGSHGPNLRLRAPNQSALSHRSAS
jgi:hypothetical protein